MTQLPKPFHGFYGVPMFSADQMRAHEAAVRADERERIAREFDRRAPPGTGFYDPHEPAEIVRAMEDKT